jgi:dTDP-4-dehydrorhamnose reductase
MALELWGGVECTVNRVGDAYLDQLQRSGHDRRADDLARFAALGLKTLRFPLLWERTTRGDGAACDWSWADERLGLARDLGLELVVGLVHHGSGPRDTSLAEADFAPRLADFAAQVATRYPWIQAYTPVNEPLTTARFSGLYGHWYPHARDGASFLRMLINECRGVADAMRAIRRVKPAALLVQTEDLGKVLSTPLLSYQAAFENERRWLSLDILFGWLCPEHPLWAYCLASGLTEAELAAALEAYCPPDVIGINHYITSNRFLDERLERYPLHAPGGNGRHRYVDIEAVRVSTTAPPDPGEPLREVWQRYRAPLVLSEVHLGCNRAEQLRWLAEAWSAAATARAEGIEIRAVTAWSLLGCYDWNTLVTRESGHYEAGIFDLRGPAPRPTALAAMVEALARGRGFDHPALDTPGWWRRPDRLLYAPTAPAESTVGSHAAHRPARRPRALLITGASGTLGTAFAYGCDARALRYHGLTRRALDVADRQAVARALEELDPWAVVNAAGYCNVDAAEGDANACFRDNVVAAAALAEACAGRGIRLLTFSSDLVFDGGQSEPYAERSATAPLNVYGRSKVEAEARVLSCYDAALVIRTSAFFGPWDEANFLTASLRRLARAQALTAADDVVVSPTYLPDLVDACLDLLIDDERGIWHLANAGATTWAEFARRGASRHGLDPQGVVGVPAAELGLLAPRPRFSALTSERGVLLSDLQHAIERYGRELRVAVS